jgi:hypothetical protein
LPDRRRTKNGQLPQDIHLSPASHEPHCGFNFWGKIRSDQSGHTSILHDFPLGHHESLRPTLLLNRRVCAGALSTRSRGDGCLHRFSLIPDTFCTSTRDPATETDAEGLWSVKHDGELR